MRTGFFFFLIVLWNEKKRISEANNAIILEWRYSRFSEPTPIASESQSGYSCKLQPGLALELRQSMPYLVQHLFAQALPYATGTEEEAILHRSRMCSFKAPVGARTHLSLRMRCA